MKFFKREPRSAAKVSLILLDWSVRESPHIIHYLRQQTVPPEQIEVIYIEFYDREFDGLRRYADRVDIWLALEMPKELYYAKHLMYNAGIVLASGDIVVICDLDALVRPTFIERIVRAFEEDPNIVFHIDQFRNMRREFYPFNFPSLEEVAGRGCINDAGGVTTGLRDTDDTLHTRNYGACFCAKRTDIIRVGGADMHIDYVGHICGPYEMSFRLRNLGRRIIWAGDEFMYHTWHPGTDGGENYFGPTDGRNFSTTAMEFLATGETAPLHENPAIRHLRTGAAGDASAALGKLIEACYADHWRAESLIARAPQLRLAAYRTPLGVAEGNLLWRDRGALCVVAIGDGRRAIGAAKEAAFPTAVLCAVFRIIDVYLRLVTTHVPKMAERLPGPRMIRRCVFVPALTLLFPLALLRRGNLRQKVAIAMGEFRDLSNPLRSLVAVLGRLAAMPREMTVLHHSNIVLAGLGLLRLLRLLPAYHARRVRDGKALAAALRSRPSDGVTVVPSSLYARYHLDVPSVSQMPDVVIV